MNLTPENKAHIDAMSYEGLFHQWRSSPVGDLWLEGETGKYWCNRMAKLSWDKRIAERISKSKARKKED